MINRNKSHALINVNVEQYSALEDAYAARRRALADAAATLLSINARTKNFALADVGAMEYAELFAVADAVTVPA